MFEEGVVAGCLLEIGTITDKSAALEGRYNGIGDRGCFEHLHFVRAKVGDGDRAGIGQNRSAETWHFDRSVSGEFKREIPADIRLIGVP